MSSVFLSYVHENTHVVKELCESLRAHDIEVWIDRDNIAPGVRWKDAIREAIQRGSYFVACFSSEYGSKSKSYMNEELVLAVDELRQHSANKPWFIPVLLSECEVPALSIGGGRTLLDFQWVSLWVDWDLGIKKILQVLKAGQIQEIKELIDQLGYDYHKRIESRRDSETPRSFYVRKVHELRDVYGVRYDPLKLNFS
ncbi:toll/interleukin-1 receptor domain-containing protein [Dokdonella immobilis]|uniref:TIR domain-containing protein n=1 Tax=Dokdonella immobilis TaxID=578942 RepID=A0A1I4WAD3_9GAMM|nr:toll/interleukin-1 receptor domain-containing protein [Dokdonella immobilis]SFN10343.1 TIR domain-containing protein [Dokdonella immobilis]